MGMPADSTNVIGEVVEGKIIFKHTKFAELLPVKITKSLLDNLSELFLNKSVQIGNKTFTLNTRNKAQFNSETNDKKIILEIIGLKNYSSYIESIKSVEDEIIIQLNSSYCFYYEDEVMTDGTIIPE